MDSLLDITICSGLNLHVNKQTITRAKKSIPKKCFGAFVTVKRSAIKEMA